MYINGKRIFAAIKGKRTLPIAVPDFPNELDITVTPQTGNNFSFNIDNDDYGVIDWGDGTETTGENAHTYADNGDYTIKFKCLLDNENAVFGSYAQKMITAARFNSPKIGRCAFYGCEALESVQLSGRETFIPEACFGESGITSIVIPDSVTEIKSGAFGECRSLTSVTIGQNVTTIGQGAFLRCSALTGIVIPNSVTSIDSGAFEDCTSLISATLGAGVRSIDYEAFKGCESLTALTIPQGVTRILSNLLYNCASLTTLNLPNSITYIGSNVIYGCADYPNGRLRINYNGTIASWNTIEKSVEWGRMAIYTVHCTDGDINN